MKKKFFAIFFALLVFCTAGVPAFADEADDWDFSEEYPTAEPTGVTINVYNWGEYISNGTEGSLDVNAEFTRRTGIEVNYTTFDSNESLYSKLAGGGASYDVIVPSDYMISKLMNENMLAELDFSNIPNFEYIDEQFRNPDYDPENKFSVPYTWGTVGLFYNTDYVTEPVTSWSILWDEQYSGKILMFDNPRDAFAIAQERLGFSLNSTDESEWEQAAMLLKEQKPLVQAYVMDQIFDKMESGEAWLAPYYSGDAGTLVENNENIKFIVPEEGTNYFVDAMCIPATAEHKKKPNCTSTSCVTPKFPVRTWISSATPPRRPPRKTILIPTPSQIPSTTRIRTCSTARRFSSISRARRAICSIHSGQRSKWAAPANPRFSSPSS